MKNTDTEVNADSTNTGSTNSTNLIKFDPMRTFSAVGLIIDDKMKDDKTAIALYELQLYIIELAGKDPAEYNPNLVYNAAHIQQWKNRQRSLELFESIKDKDLDAMHMLGKMMKYYDPQKAIDYLTIGAEQNHIKCIFELGEIYFRGIDSWKDDFVGIDKDMDKAIEYFSKSANLGDIRSMRYLATNIYRDGDYQNSILEMQWLKQIPYDKRNPFDWYNIGLLYLFHTYDRDQQRVGLNIMYDLVEKYNDPDAMRIIGEAFQKGKANLTIDEDEAIKWFLRSDDYDSHFLLAKIYLGRDSEKHLHHLKKAMRLRRNENFQWKYHAPYKTQKIQVEVKALVDIVKELDDALKQIEEYELRPPLIGGRMFREARDRFRQTTSTYY